MLKSYLSISLAGLAMALTPGIALAHAKLVSSSPAANATVPAAKAKSINLSFKRKGYCRDHEDRSGNDRHARYEGSRTYEGRFHLDDGQERQINDADAEKSVECWNLQGYLVGSRCRHAPDGQRIQLHGEVKRGNRLGNDRRQAWIISEPDDAHGIGDIPSLRASGCPTRRGPNNPSQKRAYFLVERGNHIVRFRISRAHGGDDGDIHRRH